MSREVGDEPITLPVMYKNHWVVRAAFALFVLLVAIPDRPAWAGDAANIVEEFNAKLMAVMKAADRRLFERYQMLAAPVERTFHLPFMLQQAAGARWRGATEEERARLVQAFTRLSVGTFVFRFREYEGETFKVVGEGEGANQTRLVFTEFVRPGRQTVPVTYVARQFDGGRHR